MYLHDPYGLSGKYPSPALILSAKYLKDYGLLFVMNPKQLYYLLIRIPALIMKSSCRVRIKKPGWDQHWEAYNVLHL